jgi:mannose-1-phosphate guanylyltransferase
MQLVWPDQTMPTLAPLPMRSSVREPTDSDAADLHWTLALAGGEGSRLQRYITERFGLPIPKQYCPLLGDRSLLEHTLDRMNAITPPARTITVIGNDHGAWARPQLAGRSDHVFCQPASRDTAVAVYVALAMIMRWHPNAIVTIVPTDHHVAPTARFVEALAGAATIAAQLRELVVLLAVAPTRGRA